jgi:hypothetical protein
MLVANPALRFHEGRPQKNGSTYVMGIWGVFRDKVTNFRCSEPLTGNFNSLMFRKNSLFFLSLDALLRQAKRRELCSMSCGAMRERER